MRNGTMKVVAVGALALGLMSQAQAGDPGRKLGRGAANVAMGVAEIPRTIMEENRRHGPLTAALWGPIKGIWRTVGREIAGVHDIVTFPAPVPPHYGPVIHPEFPWDLEGSSTYSEEPSADPAPAKKK